MDNSSLESILSVQAEPETPTPEVTTQPETVAEAPQVQEQEQTTGEETAPPAETQKEDPLEKHRKGLEAAATAERKKRQEAEARAEAAERRAQALEQQYRQPQPTQQHQQDDPKPQRAQFETEDEWLDARDAWRDRERTREWSKREQEQAALAYKQKTESVFAEAMKLPGFDLQAFAQLPVPTAMADAILDSEVAPQLVHYLTANPAEAYRIAALSATRQAKELARIEDKLNAAHSEPAPAQEKKPAPQLPETLTQARDARGRFEPAYDGPTPLNAILATK